MTFEDWKIALPIQLKGLVGNLNDGAKESLSVQEPQPMQVYKWQDDEGQWRTFQVRRPISRLLRK